MDLRVTTGAPGRRYSAWRLGEGEAGRLWRSGCDVVGRAEEGVSGTCDMDLRLSLGRFRMNWIGIGMGLRPVC